MNSTDTKKRITIFIVLLYFLVFLVYAYFRYIHFKGMDFAINATFIINKALASAAVLSVASSYLISSYAKLGNKVAKRYLSYKRYFGLAGFYFMALHIFFGLRIVNNVFMPQFFSSDGDFTIRGQVIIALGILGFLLFLSPAITSIGDVMKKLDGRKWQILQKIGYAAFSVILLHVSIIGYENWFSPNNWPGGIPPITLICVSVIAFTLIMRLIAFIKTSKSR